MTQRTVLYWAEEHGRGDELREAPLWQFLRAIPYLAVCGIFPPRHVLNEFLQGGRGGGGMSPGAHWVPFEVTEAEYEAALPWILNPPGATRSEWERLKRDHELDCLTSYAEWVRAVAVRYEREFALRMAALQREMALQAHKKG